MPLFLPLLAVPALAATASGAADAYASIARQLAAQFDRHPIVQIGEFHRSREIHALIQALLHDPHFICRADAVVVEFGNARLQPLADRYSAGAALSEAELTSLWRETAVPLTWNSPVYRAVYESVRAINTTQRCPHPVRLVLADAPLDWSRIHRVADYAPWTDRDGAMAATIEREVLARHQHALFISGKYHALKRVPPDMGEDEVTAQRLERAHPGAVFSVISVPVPDAAVALRLAPAPSFSAVEGTALAAAPLWLTYPDWSAAQSSAAPPKGGGLRIGESVDGLLNLGGDHSVYPPPTLYLDPDYLRELRRRATLIRDFSGQDFLAPIEALVKEGEALRRRESAAPAQP